jgi:hypothetical protein
VCFGSLLASIHFMATLLGKKKKTNKIYSTSNMSSNDISEYEVDYTYLFNFKSLNHPVLLEKLFDELH